MKDLHTLDKYRLTDDERKYIGKCGDSGNGIFKVFVNGKSFLVIASNVGGWEHVSASRKDRCPTWDEMCAIKDMFFYAEECVVQYHPPKSEYVNQHPYCLHLWKPTFAEVPLPPKLLCEANKTESVLIRLRKRQNTYKEYLEPQSRFDHRFAPWARNHRGWAKMKAFNRRLAKRRLRRAAMKDMEVDASE